MCQVAELRTPVMLARCRKCIPTAADGMLKFTREIPAAIGTIREDHPAGRDARLYGWILAEMRREIPAFQSQRIEARAVGPSRQVEKPRK